MEWMLALLQSFVGLVMIHAGARKLMSPGSFNISVRQLTGLGPTPVRLVSRFLPVVEMALGSWVLARVLVPVAVLAVAVLIGIFTVALGIALLAGKQVACSCFGAANQRPITGSSVVRNVGLIAPAMAIVPLHLNATPVPGGEYASAILLTLTSGLTVAACAAVRKVLKQPVPGNQQPEVRS